MWDQIAYEIYRALAREVAKNKSANEGDGIKGGITTTFGKMVNGVVPLSELNRIKNEK